MTEETSGSGWRRWLGFGVTGLIGLGFGLVVYIWLCPWPPAPNLVIEDDDIGSWMAINNTFTIEHDASGNPVYDRDLRAGLLVQIGDYEHGESTFSQVVLKKGTTVVDTYPSGTFSWINVVSPWGGNPPMDPGKHEFKLYPNAVFTSGLCKKVEACADQAFVCNGANMGSLVGDCLRMRLLHTDFNLAGILTYWQGAKGHSMSAAQTVPVLNVKRQGQKRNAYQVTFADSGYTVDVYRYPYQAYPNAVPVKSYAAGAVTQILIQPALKGPNHGSHYSPPWPPPEP